MQDFTFIDVSGLGNSGKSAVVDILREVDGIYVPPYWFELDIIRTPGGLLDLRSQLLSNWSNSRAHHALTTFLSVSESMGADPRWSDTRMQLRATGQRYDSFFRGLFTAEARRFAESFIVGSFTADWPFEAPFQSPWRRLARRLSRRAGFPNILRSNVLMVDGQDFDIKVRQFLNKLHAAIAPTGTRFIVLNNGLEPFNPVPGLNMLGNSYQIVVTRDPRDIYVSGLPPAKLALHDKALIRTEKNYGLHSQFLAGQDVRQFVARQKLLSQHLYRGNDPRVLNVRFEDLVNDYEHSLRKIFSHIGVAAHSHVSKGAHFNPQRSAQNCGLWRLYRNRDEIEYIANQLAGDPD